MWSEWWIWAPAWLGLIGGSYGAWRAWRTQRAFDLVASRWEIEAISDAEVRLRSRLPYTAKRLEIEVPGDLIWHRPDVLPVPTEVPVKGYVRLMILSVYGSVSDSFVIRWTHLGRRHHEVIALPTAERKAFGDQQFDRLRRRSRGDDA